METENTKTTKSYDVYISRIRSTEDYATKKKFKCGNKFNWTYMADAYKSTNVYFLVHIFNPDDLSDQKAFLTKINKHWWSADNPSTDDCEVFWSIKLDLMDMGYDLQKDRFFFTYENGKRIDIVKYISESIKADVKRYEKAKTAATKDGAK